MLTRAMARTFLQHPPRGFPTNFRNDTIPSSVCMCVGYFFFFCSWHIAHTRSDKTQPLSLLFYYTSLSYENNLYGVSVGKPAHRKLLLLFMARLRRFCLPFCERDLRRVLR